MHVSRQELFFHTYSLLCTMAFNLNCSHPFVPYSDRCNLAYILKHVAAFTSPTVPYLLTTPSFYTYLIIFFRALMLNLVFFTPLVFMNMVCKQGIQPFRFNLFGFLTVSTTLPFTPPLEAQRFADINFASHPPPLTPTVGSSRKTVVRRFR